MTLSARPATTDDGEAILALMPRLAAFEIPASRTAKHLWMHDVELLRRWLAGNAPDCIVHVVDGTSGELAGFALVSLRPELLSHEPSAHLEAIAVAEGLEGQGVGHLLLSSVEAAARARGAESMSLHVFATNSRARSFYEKSGYDGELLRYTKPLPSA